MQVLHHHLIIYITLGLGFISLGFADEFRWALQNVSHCSVVTTNSSTSKPLECTVCYTNKTNCSEEVRTSPIADICNIWAQGDCLLPVYWDDIVNWEVDGTTPKGPPCRTDSVVFPDNYTLPQINVNTTVTILGLKGFGMNWDNFEGNITQLFIIKEGGSLLVDPTCRETTPCSCSNTVNTPLSEIVLIILIAPILPILGITVSGVGLVFLIRRYIRVKKRRAGEVFTFQTLNELDVEDETDRFDVMVVNNVEDFPSGKSNIPADLTGLLDEDSVNGEVPASTVKPHQKKVAEDKQALLTNQDEVFADENRDRTSEIEFTGTQTDL